MKPERSQCVDRERRALELRKRGLAYEQIAREVGYSNRSGARKAVKRGIDSVIREPAEELRTLELERLDALHQALWSKALEGNLGAVDRILRVMERRAQLLGLDAPRRQIVNVITEDVIDRAIQQLETELAEQESIRSAGEIAEDD